MVCMISFDEPNTRDELYLPIRVMNDELIAYENILIPDIQGIEDTLNIIFQEDESCLLCKSKQDGSKLYFYGTVWFLSHALFEDLDESILMGLLSRYSVDIFEYMGDVVFKLTLDYYDCLAWLIKKTELAVNLHREYIENFDEPTWRWYR